MTLVAAALAAGGPAAPLINLKPLTLDFDV